jgi:5-methylcytosine-specific restriction endonuclease McrA
MLPAPVTELQRLFGDTNALVTAVARLTGRTDAAVYDELQTHLASRLFFLLLGDIERAPNFDVLRKRVAAKLDRSDEDVAALVEVLVSVLANIRSAEVGSKMSFGKLPYHIRRRLLDRQAHRCGVCGWDFRGGKPKAIPEDGSPTIDHLVVFQMGGDTTDNLWILCGTCNRMKSTYIHVAERGRVWIGNVLLQSDQRSIAFWSFWRDRHCRECNATPTEQRFFASKLHSRQPWSLDNVITLCEHHVFDRETINY